jgi:hypothetical protein
MANLAFRPLSEVSQIATIAREVKESAANQPRATTLRAAGTDVLAVTETEAVRICKYT